MIHSFDIFDTCFVRSCGSPLEVFRILAQRVLPVGYDKSMVKDFVSERIKAENKARTNRSSNEDVTLAQIYTFANFSHLVKKCHEQIMKEELMIEQQMLVPVRKIKDEIELLHQRGESVLYITDMYLPFNFLKDLLVDNGFWKEGDILFLSNEVGYTKASGNIYRYIKSKYGYGKLWHHKGDNLWSDFINPIMNHIIATRVTHDYSKVEQSAITRFGTALSLEVRNMYAISKALVLEHPQNCKIEFASDIIAPLFVTFVNSIMQDARNRNIKTLYFLARDGYILYKIAESFQDFYDIKIKYIYASRKSLYLPSLESFSKENVCSYLGTDISDAAKTLYKLNLGGKIDGSNYSSGMDVIDDIFENRKIYDAAHSVYEEQKSLVIRYFEQEGLANNDSYNAIVDLRGTRKCHQSINNILNSNGYKSVFAYYLEVEEGRYPRNTDKDQYYAAIHREDTIQSGEYYHMHICCAMLEQYFCATPQNRTTAYIEDCGKIKPVFEQLGDIKDKEPLSQINVQICQEFSKAFMDCRLNSDSEYLFRVAYSSLIDFVKHPTPKLLEVFNNVMVSENPYEIKYIVKKLTPKTILKRNITWIEGSVMYTFGSFGLRIFNCIKPIFKCLNILH